MNAKYAVKILFIPAGVIVTALGLLATARADVGPKPSQTFEFHVASGAPLTILEGKLLECADVQCQEAEPMREMGPQRFTCEQTSCSSMAYGYPEYMRLEITFSDGSIRRSNVFTMRYFRAQYDVAVQAEGLVVTERRFRIRPLPETGTVGGYSLLAVFVCTGISLVLELAAVVLLSARTRSAKSGLRGSRGLYMLAWAAAFAPAVSGAVISLSFPITLLVEALLGTAYALLRKKPWFIWLTLVLAGNTLTLVFLWGALTLMDYRSYLAALLVLEALVALTEALVLFFPQRQEIRFGEALAVSLGLNAVTFLIGLVLVV